MARRGFVQGLEVAQLPVFPPPVESTSAPTSSDINYELGQVWVRKDTAQVYILAQLASGAASWTLASPGASDVDTLTGDSGGAISPAAGNITLAGGTNMTTAGAGSTITINLDAAISLATSVTSPLFTAGAGVDLAITSPTGQDAVVKMGDAAGSNKVSFIDSSDVEVANLDSDGNLTAVGGTFSGNVVLSSVATQLQMNGGAVTDFIGQATLSSGTVTVANTNIAAGDRIFLSYIGSSIADSGNLSYTISAGESFTIESTNGSDANDVAYFIVRQN